jgi:hypothetical protein
MSNSISEKIIEDILTIDKSILSEVLNINQSDLSIIARQKILDSGKLDMLYLYQDEILLIELKAVPFYPDIVIQINNYYEDLVKLQNQHKLINSIIKKIIMVTNAKESDLKFCSENNIKILKYNPEFILSKFYENFKELSHFLKLQSGDWGVVRLGLILPTLNFLNKGLSIREILHEEGKSYKTINNRLNVASLLNLVLKFKSNFYLTDLGNKIMNLSSNHIEDRFNEDQINILSSFIIENPYHSQITYSILSIVESIFVLSKNTYPVSFDSLKDYFVKLVGKTNTWQSDKARTTATYIFSNYSCELNLLVKVNNSFYLTPDGIKAILLLQLNRSIKLIGSR